MPLGPANFPSSFGADSSKLNAIGPNFPLLIFIIYLFLLATFIASTITNNPSANEGKGRLGRRVGYSRTLREEGKRGRNDGFVQKKIGIGGK
jgi:hypothetical protein